MNPPSEYFEQCESWHAGAQRVGANWFRFRDEHQLELWLGDLKGSRVERDQSETMRGILDLKGDEP